MYIYIHACEDCLHAEMVTQVLLLCCIAVCDCAHSCTHYSACVGMRVAVVGVYVCVWSAAQARVIGEMYTCAL